jgi:DNA invertase Pin-like site-specific DNA recombinase
LRAAGNRPIHHHTSEDVRRCALPYTSEFQPRTSNPDAQLAPLRSYANRCGLEALEYVDHGISGRRRSRPAFDAMLKAARRREVDCIIVARLDRMARSLAHMATLGEELNELGVKLVSLHEALDTSSAMGRAMFGMCGVFAQLEADILRERTHAGLAAARRRGVRLGRPRALDEERVARARRMREAGRSLRYIAGVLGVAHGTVMAAVRAGAES